MLSLCFNKDFIFYIYSTKKFINSENMIYNQLLVKLHVGIFFFLFSISNIFSQTTIKGKIVDSETNEDLIGATVKIVNSSIGAVTDFNGEFILKTKLNLPFSIEISYIGYELQLIDLKENKFFQIALQSKDLQLKAVEVLQQ